MATFEQLPADQRAIIELVLKRGRTYDALSEMLDMPTARVRELARDALAELAPHTAKRVDPDWRAQVADYVLGQQSGPESAATQGHLRRSEAARAWLLSLMDSLDQLYANGSRPELPEGGGDRPRARDRQRSDRDATARDEADKPTKTTSPLTGGRPGGPLSPAARAALMRRRLIGGAAALVLLVVAVLLLTGSFPGQGDDGGNPSSSTPASTAADTTAAAGPTELVGQFQLKPVGNQPKGTAGVGGIAKTGNKLALLVQAKLPPTGAKEAYEVWLYNSPKDAISLGGQQTDAQGNYQGAGDLPTDFSRFKYIDVSREKLDRNAAHSGNSVLRVALADVTAPPPQNQGGSTPTTPTTPTP